MEILYTKEIGAFVHDKLDPYRVRWDIVEHPEHWNLWLVFYRDDLNTFIGEEKFAIANAVREIIEKIRNDGTPIYTEVRAGNGR